MAELRETRRLEARPDVRVLAIEEMEERLEAQITGPCGNEAWLCVWYVCTDVCPPGG